MCFFGGGGSPEPPPRMKPAPPLKAVAPPADVPLTEKLRETEDSDEKVSTRRKKALEIKRVQRGVKEFGAIDPDTMPQTPTQGVVNPK